MTNTDTQLVSPDATPNTLPRQTQDRQLHVTDEGNGDLGFVQCNSAAQRHPAWASSGLAQ